MTTNSYLEYFLTLLGWLINNGLWDVLISTGLFTLPLVIKVAGIWLKTREEGEDEGNKGMLSLPRIENALYGAFLVMIACCVPLVQVSLSTLEFDKTRARTCGTWTPKPDESGYSGIISSMDGESAAAPVWWVLIHKLSKGVTQAAVASIPCRPDLRQLRFEVQRAFIENRALADELQDFLAFAAYEFKTVITLTFVIFATNFLTFWWELARWLDSWLLTALYSSSTHSNFNMMGFQNEVVY